MVEDPTPLILRYLYNNQDFEVIVNDIHEQNVIHLYSMAYIWQAPKLLADLEHYICEKVIASNNAQKFYIEGVRFKNENITKLCEAKILDNFDVLCKEGVLQIP